MLEYDFIQSVVLKSKCYNEDTMGALLSPSIHHQLQLSLHQVLGLSQVTH